MKQISRPHQFEFITSYYDSCYRTWHSALLQKREHSQGHWCRSGSALSKVASTIDCIRISANALSMSKQFSPSIFPFLSCFSVIFRTAAWDWIPAVIAAAHVMFAPYTKVEESINVQVGYLTCKIALPPLYHQLIGDRFPYLEIQLYFEIIYSICVCLYMSDGVMPNGSIENIWHTWLQSYNPDHHVYTWCNAGHARHALPRMGLKEGEAYHKRDINK